MLPYRPTLYHLMKFAAPERTEVTKRRHASIAQVMEDESSVLKSRAVDLINHESSKVLPRDWLCKKEQIAVDVHSMNVMVVRAS